MSRIRARPGDAEPFTCQACNRVGRRTLGWLFVIAATRTHKPSVLVEGAKPHTLDLGLFMPVTEDLAFTFRKDPQRSWSAMSLLAVDHFNRRDSSVVAALADYASCPIQFNNSFVDTGWKAENVVEQYIESYKRDDVNYDLIVGPARSACSVPVATLAGIDKIPQVSYWSTSPSLEDKSAYPYFSRTIPSDSDMSYAVAQLMHNFDYDFMGIVHLSDAYGQAYAEALVTEAAVLGVSVTSKGFTSGSTEAIDIALSRMKDANLNVFILVCFDEDFVYVMTKAEELGLLGKGKLWIFTDGVDLSGMLSSLDDSVRAKLHGSARILASSCVGNTANEALVASWNSQTDMSFFNDQIPGDYAAPWIIPEVFTTDQYWDESVVCYVYDAVMSQGLAACNAWAALGDEATSADRLQYLRDLTFLGPSGTVVFEDNGNRDPVTGYYILQNVVLDESGEPYVEMRGTWALETGWNTAQITFSDGTNNPPPSITKPVHELNLVPVVYKYITFSLLIFSLVLGVGFSIWTFINRDTKIVRSSQPFFLYLIIFGCLVSSCAIVPMSYDDAQILSQGDDDEDGVDDDSGETDLNRSVDVACRAVPFLYGLGFVITFTSLFAKIQRVLRLFDNAAAGNYMRARVGIRDMMVYIVFGISIEAVICGAWAHFDPLHWERKVTHRNEFNFPTESYGHCVSEHAWYYMGPMLLLHVCALFYAVWLCYKTRNISTDFQEGKWISIAMVSNLQIVCFGVLILYMLGSGPSVSYFIRCGIIFLNDVGVLLVIFVPKVYAQNLEADFLGKVGIAPEKSIETNAPVYGEEGLEADDNATRDNSGRTGPTRFNPAFKGAQGTQGGAKLTPLKLPSRASTRRESNSNSSGNSGGSSALGQGPPGAGAPPIPGSLQQLISSQKENSRVSQESVTSLSPRR
mmetsp:Transcript_82729/g.233828  ORF Transcript_82729/g.233828 Transcript_82729/m.233828 type:complete len:916 (-) Transcript_82729:46-2793(-)